MEPFGYSYLELERQIPRDFCPGKLHKFSRGVCHFLHALSLFPPVISTDRRGSLIYSLQSMAVPTWVEYKIEKSFDPGLLNVAVELFWVRIYIYIHIVICHRLFYSMGREISIWKLSTVAIELQWWAWNYCVCKWIRGDEVVISIVVSKIETILFDCVRIKLLSRVPHARSELRANRWWISDE